MISTMISIGKHTLSRRSPAKRSIVKRFLALALALTMLCPPVSCLMLTAQAQEVPPASPQIAPAPASDSSSANSIRIPTAPVQPGPIRTILLFPFANDIPAAGTAGGFNPDIVGARVEDAIKLRLNVIGRYKADSFSPALPQIKRALEESRVEGLTENDLTPPYQDPQKGAKIATQIGTDGYLLGTVEALSIDPATRNVTLTVSASLYYTATGANAKVLAYTGHGISYNPTDDPDNLLQSAINDVAGHIVSALNASSSKQQPMALAPTDYVRGHRDNSGSILLGILLLSGIGLAIASSHHGSSSSSSSSTTTTDTGTGGPPSPPVIATGGGSPPNPPNP